MHVSCPSDKEEEKSTKDGAEKEEKDKNKEKAPRKMLSRGEVVDGGCTISMTSFLEQSLQSEGKDFFRLARAPAGLQASCSIPSDLVAF